MGLKFWDGFTVYVEKNEPSIFSWEVAFDLLKKLKSNKNLGAKEISFGKSILTTSG